MKKIRIIQDGPYEVSGEVPLVDAEIVPCADNSGASDGWIKHKTYNTGSAPYMLCRCGYSKNKPFCDGAHYAEGFNGEETADRRPYDEQAVIYQGRDFEMMDQEDLCAVARFCDVGIGAWRLTLKSNDPKNTDMIEKAKELASECPSGRLTIREANGEKLEPELPQEIYVTEDTPKGYKGPVYVRGGIEVESADGTTYELRNRVTLCRCGESENKPFCDAAHLRCSRMKLDDD